MNDKKKILMIDDDINLVNVIKIVLETKDYIFDSAYSVTERLKKIKELNPYFIIDD